MSLNDPLEAKREELASLKQTVGDLEEEFKQKRESKKRERSQKKICLYMDNLIIPYLEGIAQGGFNEPLTVGIRRLIMENKNPFRQQEGWDRTKETYNVIDRFLQFPRVKMLKPLVKPFLKRELQDIQEDASWIRENVLKQEYPDIYMAVMETEGGPKWLDQLIDDFLKTIKHLVRT